MKKLTDENSREQFEAWVINHYCYPAQFSRHDTSGDYENLTVRASWRAWQASREALHILEQQERGGGEWIEWGGGECPPVTGRVQMKWADGSLITGLAGDWRWSHEGGFSSIIAYRIIPEQPTNQNGEQ